MEELCQKKNILGKCIFYYPCYRRWIYPNDFDTESFAVSASGEFKIKSDTPFKLFLFGMQTILFPPLAEEIFYRKYLIVYDSKTKTAVTILISSFLFAAEHAIYPFGIVTYMILGFAFGLAYLKHKNIYVMMTAHFLSNTIGNGIPMLMVLLG
jgi:hypothetical protein